MNGYVIILLYTFNTVSSVINLERRTFSRYILLVEFEKKKKNRIQQVEGRKPSERSEYDYWNGSRHKKTSLASMFTRLCNLIDTSVA